MGPSPIRVVLAGFVEEAGVGGVITGGTTGGSGGGWGWEVLQPECGSSPSFLLPAPGVDLASARQRQGP